MKQVKQFILIPLLLIWSQTFSQQPIFATIGGGDLYSFDLINCTRHFIGSTGQGFGDIAFTPDGRLWGIVSGQLYQIDTSTATASLVGNTGIHSVTLVGLNDTILLAEFGEKLYGINNINATSYYIDTIGYQAAGDLTWYDDDLYMTTPVIKIVLNGTNTAIVSVTSIGSSVPGCEGAITASFINDYNSIVGFNGPNLYKICQIDGSYEMLCPSLNIGGTPGAASIRLATQIPPPTTCHVLNSTENIIEYDFQIFPTPFPTHLQIHYTITEPGELMVYDALGRKVKSYALAASQNIFELSVAELPVGVYLVAVNSGGRVSGEMVVKE